MRHRGERIDEPRGQHAGDEAQRGERAHRGERPAVRLTRLARYRAARPAEERDAERLDEARGGERRGEREQRADRRH